MHWQWQVLSQPFLIETNPNIPTYPILKDLAVEVQAVLALVGSESRI